MFEDLARVLDFFIAQDVICDWDFEDNGDDFHWRRYILYLNDKHVTFTICKDNNRIMHAEVCADLDLLNEELEED